MYRHLKGAIATALLAAPLHAAPFADPYTSLFILGDSHSSDGGTITRDRWIYDTAGGAPYAEYDGEEPFEDTPGGTYTNGPNWSSVLTEAFQADGKFAINFAHPGATALPSLGGPLAPVLSSGAAPATGPAIFLPPDDPDEGDRFLSSAPSQLDFFDPVDLPTELQTLIGNRPLISMWFGTEDLLDALEYLREASVPVLAPGTAPSHSPDPFSDMFDIMEGAADSIVDAVQYIAEAGPQFRDFQIINLSPAQVYAYVDYDDTFEYPEFLADIGEDLVDIFNETLAQGLDRLVNPPLPVLSGDGPSPAALHSPEIVDLNVSILDLDPILFDIFLRRIGDSGPGGPDPLAPCITFQELDPGRMRTNTCPDPTQTLFLDPQHFEASVHGDLGIAAARAVGVTPVPLPAGAWLLLGGVGLLALRRKRAA